MSPAAITTSHEAVRIRPVVPSGLTGPDRIGRIIIVIVLSMLAFCGLLWWHFMHVDRAAIPLAISSFSSIQNHAKTISSRAYTIPISHLVIGKKETCTKLGLQDSSDILQKYSSETQTLFDATEDAFQGTVPLAASVRATFTFSAQCIEQSGFLSSLEIKAASLVKSNTQVDLVKAVGEIIDSDINSIAQDGGFALPGDISFVYISLESDDLAALFRSQNSPWNVSEFNFAWTAFPKPSGNPNTTKTAKNTSSVDFDPEITVALTHALIYPFLFPRGNESRKAYLSGSTNTLREGFTGRLERTLLENSSSTPLATTSSLLQQMYNIDDLGTMLQGKVNPTSVLSVELLLLTILSSPDVHSINIEEETNDQENEIDEIGISAWTWSHLKNSLGNTSLKDNDENIPFSLLSSFAERISASGSENISSNTDTRRILPETLPSAVVLLSSREIPSFGVPFSPITFLRSETKPGIPTPMISHIMSGQQWRPTALPVFFPEQNIHFASYVPLVTYALDRDLSRRAFKGQREKPLVRSQVLPSYGVVVEVRPPTGVADSMNHSKNGIQLLDESTLIQLSAHLISGLRIMLGLPSSLQSFHIRLETQGKIKKHIRIDPSLTCGVTTWESNFLSRQRAVELVVDTRFAIQKLLQQVENDPESPLPPTLVQKIDDVENLLQKAANPNLRLPDVFRFVNVAWNVAQAALHSTESLSKTRMPVEHVYAVYAPYFAPMAFPILVALIKWLKAIKDQKKKKREEEKATLGSVVASPRDEDSVPQSTLSGIKPKSE